MLFVVVVVVVDGELCRFPEDILKNAFGDADVVPVEDELGSVLICFAGMGIKKDTTGELMLYIDGLKNVWPEPFA